MAEGIFLNVLATVLREKTSLDSRECQLLADVKQMVGKSILGAGGISRHSRVSRTAADVFIP